MPLALFLKRPEAVRIAPQEAIRHRNSDRTDYCLGPRIAGKEKLKKLWQAVLVSSPFEMSTRNRFT